MGNKLFPIIGFNDRKSLFGALAPRWVLKGEDRKPRTKPFTVYLSEDEIELLDKRVKQLGVKSRSGLVTSILLPLMNSGFSALSFVEFGFVKCGKVREVFFDFSRNYESGKKVSFMRAELHGNKTQIARHIIELTEYQIKT